MNNYVITIAREFGCGGRDIGKMLADKLGIDYYDRNLITLAAKANQADEAIYEKYDEKATNRLNNIFTTPHNFGIVYSGIPMMYAISDDVFFTQSDIIKEISKKPCVIVGRCADYILKGQDNLVTLFLYSSIEKRQHRVIEKYNPSPGENIKKILQKADKQRASYYARYTGMKWGDPHNYDLTINTSKLTNEDVVDIIVKYLETCAKSREV